MKAFLDHFAAILGCLTVTLLLTSIVHEYGYFSLIGRNFQTLLTTSDYLANAVLWLPLVLMFALGVEWENLDVRPSTQKLSWKDWRRWPAALFAVIMLLAIITSPWPPSPLSMSGIMLIIIWIWSRVHKRFYRPIEGLEDLNLIYLRVVKVGPPFLALVFLWGWIQGSIDARTTSDPYLVRFKDQEQAQLRVLLRNFERGLLMRNAVSNRIEFQKWDGVLTLEKVPSDSSESFACFFISALCHRKEIPPP
jgi:hypothetical protein